VNLAKNAIALIAPLKTLIPYKGSLNIGIDICQRGGFDKNIKNLNLPLKFPPLDFYINSLKMVLDKYENTPVYCYLFTDAKHPEIYAKKFRYYFSNYQNLNIDYRIKNNEHNQNILEDFFSFLAFDILIYPQSNFSMVPALLHDYILTCTVKSHTSSTAGNLDCLFKSKTP
jgi:hypothetical protein